MYPTSIIARRHVGLTRCIARHYAMEPCLSITLVYIVRYRNGYSNRSEYEANIQYSPIWHRASLDLPRVQHCIFKENSGIFKNTATSLMNVIPNSELRGDKIYIAAGRSSQVLST